MIPNVGGPIAVSPLGGVDNILYATNGQSIVAFKFGQTKPDRTIALPPTSPGSSWNVVGLAVDKSGYLYVGAVPQASNAFGGSHGIRVPNAGVLVYSPTANGHAHPVAAISNGSVLAIAIDEADNLFLCGQDALQHGFCDRYRNVRTHPKVLSSFSGPTLANVPGVAIFRSEVYLSGQDQTHRYDFTAQVFPTTANGSPVPPTREIFATSGSLEGQLAAFAGKLYVEDGHSAGGIWEFDADANGDQPALSEVVQFAYGANGLAIGR